MEPTDQPLLGVRHVAKSYPGGVQALRDVSLNVARGEIVCVLGPSGCGKTTLLRVVAGLEQPDGGEVRFDGCDLMQVPVHQRGFGFMFQDYALFPHRTVAENVEFGLRMANLPLTERRQRVQAMLELVNLPGYGDRTIFELSGGERQRVALARSLAPSPPLLMLDEPLGSLDRGLREALVEELRSILQEMAVTALYVTHDQDEAMALGDRLVIMQRGQIEQVDKPSQVYTQPATAFVARFMGFTNLLPATPQADGVMTPIGHFPLPAIESRGPQTLLIRPEAARLISPTLKPQTLALVPGLHPWQANRQVVQLVGKLAASTYHGRHYQIQMDVEVAAAVYRLSFELPTFQRAEIGAGLSANQLPQVGGPLHLLVYCDLATLLPYGDG